MDRKTHTLNWSTLKSFFGSKHRSNCLKRTSRKLIFDIHSNPLKFVPYFLILFRKMPESFQTLRENLSLKQVGQRYNFFHQYSLKEIGNRQNLSLCRSSKNFSFLILSTFSWAFEKGEKTKTISQKRISCKQGLGSSGFSKSRPDFFSLLTRFFWKKNFLPFSRDFPTKKKENFFEQKFSKNLIESPESNFINSKKTYSRTKHSTTILTQNVT